MTLTRINEQQWYRTAAKADGITLIDEPWIKPFYRCNIWHIQGRKCGMVVDFGLGAVPLRQRRLNELPVRTVHGGHFPSFSGQHLKRLIDDWLRQHDL